MAQLVGEVSIVVHRSTESARVRVIRDRGAAIGCCKAYFDEDIAKTWLEIRLIAVGVSIYIS